LYSLAYNTTIIVFDAVGRVKSFERALFETQTRNWLYLGMIVMAWGAIMNSVPTQKFSLLTAELTFVYEEPRLMHTAFLLRSHLNIKSASLTLDILWFRRLISFLGFLI
jgi:hypothetical protein